MYDFLKEAAGMLDSKDELLIRAMQEDDDEVQIDKNDPWWAAEEDEEEEVPYSYIWDIPIPETVCWLDEDAIDNLDDLTPYEIDDVASYLTEMEELLEIEFPNHTYNTPLDELPFLYWIKNGNGSVTFSIDQGDLIDYLNDEC